MFVSREFLQLIFTGESSGRLLKYNPTTKVTTVLLRDLQFPNGVTLSKDESFLLFSDARLRLVSDFLILLIQLIQLHKLKNKKKNMDMQM